MIINNNIPALNTHRQLGINQGNMQKSMEKLSSGLRINRAGDDAAGLAISEKMRGQIRGLDQASRNAADGVSLIQTAEGALNETHSILQRMRELAVQSSNDTNTIEDRAELQKEMNQLYDEVDRIAGNTEFNTKKLLGGSDGTEVFDGKFHIGANDDQSITLTIGNMRASGIGLSGLNIDEADFDTATELSGIEAGGGTAHGLLTQSGADAAIATIDSAIGTVSSQRSALGAVQNRLEHTIANLDNSSENLSAAESRVRDVDMAKE